MMIIDPENYTLASYGLIPGTSFDWNKNKSIDELIEFAKNILIGNDIEFVINDTLWDGHYDGTHTMPNLHTIQDEIERKTVKVSTCYSGDYSDELQREIQKVRSELTRQMNRQMNSRFDEVNRQMDRDYQAMHNKILTATTY